jgi:serine/threonine protein kinase
MTADAHADGRPPEEDTDGPREHARIGGYRLVQRLGEGGMGTVHLALDGHGRAVAIKVLRPHVAHDPAARARLSREVDTLSRIRSPRVAPVVDADVDGETPFIVTRYVPGPPLDEYVADRGPLPPADLHRVAAGLAEALEAIHEVDVVHRDVKPGNVLLVDGDPVLIDFGIAHVVDDVRLTSTGLVMGTPGYLAPEVIHGEDVTEATDWWGWAATTAFAATGTPPFGTGAMNAVLARVAAGDPDLRAVDPRIEPLLFAALSPHPHERPHQDEVVRALERFAHGAPVTEAIEVRRSRPAQTERLASPSTAALPAAGAGAGAGAGDGAGSGPAGGAAAAAGVAGAAGLAAGASAAAGGPPPVAHRVAPPTQPPPPPPGTATGRPAGPPGWEQARQVGQPPPPVAQRPPQQQLPPPPPQVAPYQQVPPPAQAGQYGQPGRPVPEGESDWDAARYGHGEHADPRIGRPLRTGTLLALLALLASLTAAAPLVGVLALAVWTALARTADRSVTSLVMRRHERGRRGSDVAVAVASSPWHLVVGVVGALVALAVPLFVGVCAMFAGALVTTAVTGTSAPADGVVPMLAAGSFAGLTAWWGPGGASLRRGSRSIVRGLTPGDLLRKAGAGALLVGAVALLLLTLTGDGPNWWPLAEAPGWVDDVVPAL